MLYNNSVVKIIQTNEKGFYIMQTNKIITLLNYLKNEQYQLDFNDLHIVDDNILEINGWQYYILTPQEREQVFREQVKLAWDNMGLDGFTSEFADKVLDECLNPVKLAFLSQYELIEYNEEEQQHEPLGTSWGYDNPVKYLYHDVASTEATDVINKFELLNFDELCKQIFLRGGYATTLAKFDHEEIVLGDYYAYFIGF